MTTYAEAVKAQELIEDELLLDPNISSIGVVEETDSTGQKTNNFIIQVGIISTEIYKNNLQYGQSKIPKNHIIKSAEGLFKEQSVRISVVKEGRIEALSESISSSKETDFPSAIDDSTQLINDHTSKSRPSLCGFSVGHSLTTAGTIGLLLKYSEGPNKGKAYILSNNHVLAANNLAHVNDHIIQPAKIDGGIVHSDTIARLHRWVPIKYKEKNYVDAALAEVCDGLNWAKHITPSVSKIGYPNDFTRAELSMAVEKSGRTTGYTQGRIDSINETIKVTYPEGSVVFKNQIRTTNMSKGGDSGSCLFEQGSRKPVGLLFAGSKVASFHNHFDTVLSALSKSSTNEYCLGNKHHFEETYPLKILRVEKRSYSTPALPLRYPVIKFQAGKSPLRALPLTSSVGSNVHIPRCSNAFLMLNTAKARNHVIPTAIKYSTLAVGFGLFTIAMNKPSGFFTPTTAKKFTL